MNTKTGHDAASLGAESGAPRQEIRHTVSSYFARVHLDNAERQGLSRERILAAAGLSESLLRAPRARIAPEQLATVFQEIWAGCDDELLGLTATPLRVGVFSLIAERMVDCKTLGDALEEMLRFYQLITGSFAFTKTLERGQLRISIALTHAELDPEHILIELLLLVWHRFPSWLVAKVIPLQEMQFTYAAPAHREEYPLLFPCPCRYSQAQNSMVWPAEVLSWPIRRNRTQLAAYLRYIPLPWFRKQKFHESHTERVNRLLSESALDQSVSLAIIASQFHTTERTLRRKLTEEGSCFQTMKANLRRDRAIHLLSLGEVSVAEISRQCGYTEATAFMRAFKAWTGLSPSSYRKRLIGGGSKS